MEENVHLRYNELFLMSVLVLTSYLSVVCLCVSNNSEYYPLNSSLTIVLRVSRVVAFFFSQNSIINSYGEFVSFEESMCKGFLFYSKQNRECVQ